MVESRGSLNHAPINLLMSANSLMFANAGEHKNERYWPANRCHAVSLSYVRQVHAHPGAPKVGRDWHRLATGKLTAQICYNQFSIRNRLTG
jgi:hypothetical protein